MRYYINKNNIFLYTTIICGSILFFDILVKSIKTIHKKYKQYKEKKIINSEKCRKKIFDNLSAEEKKMLYEILNSEKKYNDYFLGFNPYLPEIRSLVQKGLIYGTAYIVNGKNQYYLQPWVKQMLKENSK